MSDKTKDRMAYVVIVMGGILGILCAIYMLPFFVCVLDTVINFSAIYRLVRSSYCSSCKSFTMDLHLFSNDPPCCRICGKKH